MLPLVCAAQNERFSVRNERLCVQYSNSPMRYGISSVLDSNPPLL